MRRIPVLASVFLLPALATVLVVGCSQPAVKTDKDKTTVVTGEKTPTVGAVTEITTATKATVAGVVKFTGDAPKMIEIPSIKGHTDKAHCMKGDVNDQLWSIDKDGYVENVVVIIAPPAGKAFKITDELKKPFAPVVYIDQPFCQYIPHVQAMYVGVQKFQAKNSAPITHNVKFVVHPKNIAAPAENLESKKATPEYAFKKQADPIELQCTAHTWMAAKLHTFDHPYFAVTKADGSFSIANVPIDEDLVVRIWHEGPNAWSDAHKGKFKEGKNDLSLSISK